MKSVKKLPATTAIIVRINPNIIFPLKFII